jgi:hypothetical protein
MTHKSIVALMFITLLLAACAGSNPTATSVATDNPVVPAPTSGSPIAYPMPVVATPVSNSAAYPGPGTSVTSSASMPASGFEPQPGDENLKRDQIFLDLATSEISVNAGKTSQVTAILKGNLSDPCHVLRAVVSGPDSHNTINIEVYSLVDTSKACATVLQPFTANIPLGSYTGSQYSVYVNGQLLGNFKG